MNQEKLTVSVSASLASFVEEYRSAHGLRTKSSVVERALQVLRERELEADYAEGSHDVDSAWDVTTADGLPDEAS